MEYTEQEIEMLARFTHESSTRDTWDAEPLKHKTLLRERTKQLLSSGSVLDYAINAAARLMREAREQGAAEMRERSARRVYEEISSYDDWHSDAPEHVRDVVLSIPVVSS